MFDSSPTSTKISAPLIRAIVCSEGAIRWNGWHECSGIHSLLIVNGAPISVTIFRARA
jgi:hypothetical protein